MPVNSSVKAVLFDKDGTLFDFQKTWSVWARRAIGHLSQGKPDLSRALGAAMHYDFETQKLRPTSPVIAMTAQEVETVILGVLAPNAAADARAYLAKSALEVPIVPVVNLRKCLGGLIKNGLVVGVMTNDSEKCAHEHLTRAGILDLFDFVAGFDSGFGGKPDPAPLLAFAQASKCAPQSVVMVGDSVHDLVAGRAAGMRTIGVLTGVAVAADLAPFADVVLPDIGHISGWLAAGE